MIDSRVRRRRVAALVAPLLLASGIAHAGARVSEPRHVHPKIDTVDSTRVTRREAGISIGTPSGLNLEIGYWPHPVYGVRVSGLYLGSSTGGVQGNFCITLRRGPRSRLALGPIVGSTSSQGDAWTYGGLALDWNTGPLFLEAGLVGGGGTFPGLENQHAGIVGKLGIMGGGGILGPRAKP